MDTFVLLAPLVAILLAVGLGLYGIRHARRHRLSVPTWLGLDGDAKSALDALAGFAISATAMTGVFLVAWSSGAVTIAGTAQPWILLTGLVGNFGTAFFEEILFRSLLLTGLILLLGNRPMLAVFLSAVLFGIVHAPNPGASALSVMSHALGGLMYGLAFVGTGRIWLPLGLHLGWNYVQGTMWGFPVSGTADPSWIQQTTSDSVLLTGGAYGPEASLSGVGFRLAVIGLTLLWLRVRRGKSDQHFFGTRETERV